MPLYFSWKTRGAVKAGFDARAGGKGPAGQFHTRSTFTLHCTVAPGHVSSLPSMAEAKVLLLSPHFRPSSSLLSHSPSYLQVHHDLTEQQNDALPCS